MTMRARSNHRDVNGAAAPDYHIVQQALAWIIAAGCGAVNLACSSDQPAAKAEQCEWNESCELDEVKGGTPGSDFACLKGGACALRDPVCATGWRFPKQESEVFFVSPGECVPEDRAVLEGGEVWCGNGWSSLGDSANCGACGVTCGSGDRCDGSHCVACTGDWQVCGGTCSYLQTWAVGNEYTPCGSCDGHCSFGATCVDGACVPCAAQGLAGCWVWATDGSNWKGWMCVANCPGGG